MKSCSLPPPPLSIMCIHFTFSDVLCDKFLSENSVLQDENLMDSVDLKKSEEVIVCIQNYELIANCVHVQMLIITNKFNIIVMKKLYRY